MHTSSSSEVADHCSVHALSDPSDKDFCQECDHQHDERCIQCDALDNLLVHMENLVHNSEFHNKEDKDKVSYLCRTSVNAIHAWKSHQLRSVHQDQAHIDAINPLDEHSALTVSNWVMKFIPQLYRVSTGLVGEVGYVLAYCCCFPPERGNPSVAVLCSSDAVLRTGQSYSCSHLAAHPEGNQGRRCQHLTGIHAPRQHWVLQLESHHPGSGHHR